MEPASIFHGPAEPTDDRKLHQTLRTATLTFAPAIRDDLVAIIELLSDDPLGAERETFEIPLPASYEQAFAAIAEDSNNELLVARQDGKILAVLQLTLIPNLTYRGSWRAQIEGVRVAKEARGRGLGKALVRAAIERAREKGCRLVQLTTDKRRPEAIHFYESLGFAATHEGMKLAIDRGST